MFTKVALSGFIFIILSYYWLNYIKHGPVYNSDKSLKGKTVLITGGNVGIGKALAIDLAKRDAKIIIASRNLAKSDEARQDIIKQTKNPNIFSRRLDLADFNEVREFAKSFIKEELYLDYLINNAGTVDTLGKLSNGLNKMFVINHFGHFLLTNLLLDKMKFQSHQRPVRIINLTSGMYRFGKLSPEVLYDNTTLRLFDMFRVYSNTKLANVYFTSELHNRLKDYEITAYSVHPGAIDTNIGNAHASKIYMWFRKWFIGPFCLRDVFYGYQTILYCALDDDVIKYSGGYFEECSHQERMYHAQNASMEKWLWEESVKITGLK